jgi:hypothetical protein
LVNPKVGRAVTVKLLVLLEHPVVELVNLKVAVPALTPVTVIPLKEATTGKAGGLTTHIPPVEGDKVVVAPTQIVGEVILTVGNELIVTLEVVLEHPVAVFVNVKVIFPGFTGVAGVTTPVVELTVALGVVGLFAAHVPPVEGVRFPVEPKQIELGAVTTGKLLIATFEVVLLQPVAVMV